MPAGWRKWVVDVRQSAGGVDDVQLGAGRAASGVSVGAAVGTLTRLLGEGLVADAAGVPVERVRLWRRGAVAVPRVCEARLRLLLQLLLMAVATSGKAAAKQWLLQANWWLDGRTPVSAVSDGPTARVLASAHSFIALEWYMGRPTS